MSTTSTRSDLLENEQVPWDVPQRYQPRVYYGFLLLCLSTTFTLIFTLWAILPFKFFESIIPKDSDLWDFIPDKRWAIIFPTGLAFTVLILFPSTILFNYLVRDETLNGKLCVPEE